MLLIYSNGFEIETVKRNKLSCIHTEFFQVPVPQGQCQYKWIQKESQNSIWFFRRTIFFVEFVLGLTKALVSMFQNAGLFCVGLELSRIPLPGFEDLIQVTVNLKNSQRGSASEALCPISYLRLFHSTLDVLHLSQELLVFHSRKQLPTELRSKDELRVNIMNWTEIYPCRIFSIWRTIVFACATSPQDSPFWPVFSPSQQDH